MHPALAIKDIWFSICRQLVTSEAAWPLLFVCRVSRAAYLANAEWQQYYYNLAWLSRFTGVKPRLMSWPSASSSVNLGPAYYAGSVSHFLYFAPLRDVMPRHSVFFTGVLLVGDHVYLSTSLLVSIARLMNHSHVSDCYNHEYVDKLRRLLLNYRILLVSPTCSFGFPGAGCVQQCAVGSAVHQHQVPPSPVPFYSTTEESSATKGLQCYPLLSMANAVRAKGYNAKAIVKRFMVSHPFIFEKPPPGEQ
jgi:hypothetical protein